MRTPSGISAGPVDSWSQRAEPATFLEGRRLGSFALSCLCAGPRGAGDRLRGADGTLVRVSSDGKIGSFCQLPAGLTSLGGTNAPAVAGFADGSAYRLSDDPGSLDQAITDPVPNRPIAQAAVAGDTGPAATLLRTPRPTPRALVPRFKFPAR